MRVLDVSIGGNGAVLCLIGKSNDLQILQHEGWAFGIDEKKQLSSINFVMVGGVEDLAEVLIAVHLFPYPADSLILGPTMY